MGRRARASAEARHAWDAQASFEDNRTTYEAGQKLADWFLRLYADGTLSTKQLCIGNHFACIAGAVGDVSKYALTPTAPSGHFQRHMDTVLPVAGAAPDLCNVDIPLHTRLEGRGKRSVPFSPVHESLAAEVVVHHGLLAATAGEGRVGA